MPTAQFGSPSSIHKYFLAWKRAAVFVRPWRQGLAEYDELERVAWRWQSIDTGSVKAPLAQEAVGPNPTDRGKKGTKRSLLVDARGIPLSIRASGANRHDVRLLVPTLDRLVCRRPAPRPYHRHHLCADRGYVGEPAAAAIRAREYVPHVPQRGAQPSPLRRRRHPARRWVVERTLSWLNRFRKLLVRFEKRSRSYEGLLELVCALIAYRQVIVIHGYALSFRRMPAGESWAPERVSSP